MKNNIWIYMLIMMLVTYLIRVLPMTLIRKEIKNKFIRSFLYYVPYVTLAVMTFPAIVNATESPVAGLCALIVGMVLAWLKLGLFPVAVASCATVFILELFLV
ncbi:MAG: AzlD domain-containing protein [Clostridia bacterium]|nr:AzlD domain-containing protein [Clostridia bacterium]